MPHTSRARRARTGPLPLLGLAGDRAIAARIRRLVEAAERIVITGHERPDGDCIGSEVALCAVLRNAGYDAEVLNSDPAPQKYRFLVEPPGEPASRAPVRLATDSEPPLAADLVFSLDATSLDRLGRVGPLIRASRARIVVLDHHPGNENFGVANWTEPSAAATGELVWRLVSCCGWDIPDLALDALYTAILTDTGQFCYSNTSARVMRMAAELIERGVRPEQIWRNVYLNKSRGELALDARARASLRSAAGGRIAYIALSRRDFEETGTGPQHTEEMVAIPRMLAGVELALFFCSVKGGALTKVSIRSMPGTDASMLARRFGGGGHKQAAACRLDMRLPQAKKRFLAEATRFLATQRPRE
jgi:phosphoesterase RecJ-like protein